MDAHAGHDIFPYFAPSFFDGIVPPARGRTLEIGCGEGRVARELSSRGHGVTAIDASRTLVRHAVEADTSSAYLAADATALPFADGTFQTVVTYNSLQAMPEFADMQGGRRGGPRAETVRATVPLRRASHDRHRPREERSETGDVLMSGSYFERTRVDETVTKDELTMTFHGWTDTLEDYVRAIEAAGFLASGCASRSRR